MALLFRIRGWVFDYVCVNDTGGAVMDKATEFHNAVYWRNKFSNTMNEKETQVMYQHLVEGKKKKDLDIDHDWWDTWAQNKNVITPSMFNTLRRELKLLMYVLYQSSKESNSS